MIGYIKLYRQILDRNDYYKDKFSRTHAWIDLLMLANFEDGVTFVRGIEVTVKRGQVARSIRDLAERWHWSVNTVRKFLRELERNSQICTKRDTQSDTQSKISKNVISLITIVNYERYQGNEEKCDSQCDTQNDTQNDTQVKEEGSPHNNNNNPPLEENNKEEKEEEKPQDKSCEQKKKSSQKMTDKRPPATAPMKVRKDWLRNEIRRVNARNKYDPDMCNAFYLYWSEPDDDEKFMRFEKEVRFHTARRLALWYYNEAKRWNK